MPAELVDTNILIYSLDESEPKKMEIARQQLTRVAAAGDGCTSTQVLAEFAVNASRKCQPVLSAVEIVSQINKISNFLKLYSVRQEHIIMATEAGEQHSLSFWDALIWAVARDHAIPVILTEDGPSGATIDGVRFKNPFVENS